MQHYDQVLIWLIQRWTLACDFFAFAFPLVTVIKSCIL